MTKQMDLIYIIIFAVYNMKKKSHLCLCVMQSSAVLHLFDALLLVLVFKFFQAVVLHLFCVFVIICCLFHALFISVIVFISYFAAFVSLKFVSLSLATRVGLKMFQSPDSRPFHSSGHCVHQCTKEYIRNAVLNVACGFQSKPL